MRIINKVICFFKGHSSEPFFSKTKKYISTKRCARCKVALGLHHWKIEHIPPPYSTSEELKSWELFCERMKQELHVMCGVEGDKKDT
ncbi:MAG: hypothetical protein H0X62_02015 [Bacteroidetes bacterium]|nr:hypothetical protein [Bacteroidota bacterium]